MTISTSYSFSNTVDEIVRKGFQKAGLLPLGRQLQVGQLTDGRSVLDDLLKYQSAMGAALTQLERTTLTTVAGTATYTLAPDTIDFEFPLMIALQGQTSEVWVERTAYADYQAIPSKLDPGKPFICYPEKGHTVTFTFYPVPDAVYSVSYRRQRLVRDATSGSTPDFVPRWQHALVAAMAHELAVRAPLSVDRCKYLAGLAESAMDAAMNRETEGGDLQFTLEDCYR